MPASLQRQNCDVTECASRKRAKQKKRTASPCHRPRASSNRVSSKLVIGNYSWNIILGQLIQHTTPYRSSWTLQSQFHSMEQKLPRSHPHPPHPNITIKRYLKFSRKKAVINRFLLLSTLSIALHFGNLMWPGGTFVIGPFFRGHMENASQLLLRETLYYKMLLKPKWNQELSPYKISKCQIYLERFFPHKVNISRK